MDRYFYSSSDEGRAQLLSLGALLLLVLGSQAVGLTFGWLASLVFNQTWFDGLKMLVLVALLGVSSQPLILGTFGLLFLTTLDSLNLLSDWMVRGGFLAWLFTIGQVVMVALLSVTAFSRPDLEVVLFSTWELTTFFVWARIITRD